MLLPLLATVMALTGVVLAALAAHVAWRRDRQMGWSLAVVLVAVAWWGLAYSVELSVDNVSDKTRWGVLKYLGVTALAPAWLTFVLQYTGRSRLVTGRLLALLAIEPVVVMTLLAVPATHDLVRYYPETLTEDLPVVEVGPFFWVHLVYNNVLLVGATWLFVASMVRLARTYRRMAMTLVAAALLPWAANLLHNFQVGWFARIDLTPFAFIVAGGLLVWGLFHERLVDLAPIARSAVLDGMADAVFVLDPFGRIVDLNPAAVGLSASSRADLLGRQLEDVRPGTVRRDAGQTEVVLTGVDGQPEQRTFDLSRQDLTDGAGRRAGLLVVLRDVTERVRDREHLSRVLAEQSRIAGSLQETMIPPELPEVVGAELASRYQPAGDGSEVGGDFLDVFALNEGTWAFVLGDVSGKGAEAAAVAASVRYTLRALGSADLGPAETLRMANAKLVAMPGSDRHCTLVYGYLCPREDKVLVNLCLAGHPPPLALRATGEVEEVGRPGTALKLFDDPELHDATFELGPGELLCMFTDGLVEARHGRDLFGTERLAGLLKAHGEEPLDDLAGHVTSEVRAFRDDRASDDLALLLLRSPRPHEG